MELRWVILAIVARVAFSGPVNLHLEADQDGDQCSTVCTESEKFGYTPGSTYEFQYNADVSSTVAGAMDEASRLHLSATVHMEVITSCEMSISLSDVSLKESNPLNVNNKEHVTRAFEFKNHLQNHPLRFSFQDGKIDVVCPQRGEPTWVSNIKKGILSTLQNTMSHLREDVQVQETDIVGRCRADYKLLSDEGDTLRVQKVKDLLSCTDRAAFETAYQALPYRSNSKIQSLPIVKSTYSCEQDIHVNGHLLRAHCIERHVLRPFSNQKNGAVTETVQILTFKKVSDGTRSHKGRMSGREELLFQHSITENEEADNVDEVNKKLIDICEESKDDIRPTVPKLFSVLIEKMRHLDGKQLEKMYKDVERGEKFCDKAKKFVRDALPQVGTTGSVELIMSLMPGDRITEDRKNILMTSLAFIEAPTKEMLAFVKPLIENRVPQTKAFLAVSTLVHTYCLRNPGCAEDKEVIDIVKVFKKNLGYKCAGTGSARDKVMLSLKAIGNTGQISDIIGTLMRCIKNNRQDMDIRVMAAASMRRLECSDEMNELLDVITDPEVDSELRIASYLALMNCPSSGHLARIRDMLANEPINQVGSFIWTHLTNLMESSDPLKKEIAAIVYDVHLNKTFDMDKRKFSRNIEWSAFSEMMNLGVNVESNLVWSSKSFIPRSASVNLNFDLFGRELNLFELGVRAEGMESVAEALFTGPEKGSHRTRRAAKKNVLESQISKKYKLPSAVESKGSAYLKVFGSEVRYDEKKNLKPGSMKDEFNYLKFLIELAKEHKIDVTRNMLFLDTTFKLPTVSGMPLKLHVTGATSVELKVKGKMDIRNIWKAPRSVDIDGAIEPSGAVVINGEMGVDAMVAQTGVSMESTMHSSTAVKGKIQLKDGKDLAINIDLPREKSEIVDIHTKFFVLHRGKQREQEMLKNIRVDKNTCVGGKFVDALGLEVCGSLAYTNAFKNSDAPWFPFTAPASAKLTLHKRDTHTGYTFAARYVNLKQKSKKNWHLSFDTPGSRIDRRFVFDVSLDGGEKSLDVDVKTPWKKYSVKGSVEEKETLKRAQVSLKIDEKREYSALAEMQIAEKKSQMMYTPRLEINLPDRDTYSIAGSFIMQKEKRIEIDLAIANIFKEDVRVTGNIDKSLSGKTLSFVTKLDAKTQWINLKVNNDIGITGRSWSSDTDLLYTLPDRPEQQFTSKSSYKDVTTRSGNTIEYEGSFVSSQFPDSNNEIIFTLERAPTKILGSAEFGHGRDYKNELNRLKVELKGNFFPDKTKTHFNGQLVVDCKKKGINYIVEYENLISSDAFRSNSMVQNNGREMMNYFVELKRESLKPLKLGAELSLNYPGRKLHYLHSIVESKKDHYQHDLTLQSNVNQVIKVTSTLINAQRKEVQAEIQIPNMSPISILVSGQMGRGTASVRGELTFNHQTYAAGGTYVFAPWKMGRLSGDLALPWKSMKGNFEVSRSRNTYFTKLEGEMNTPGQGQRKVTAKGDITLDDASPAFNVMVEWAPQQKVDVKADFMIRDRGLWSSSRKWVSDIKVTTSLRTFPQLTIKLEHVHENKDVKFMVDASWSPVHDIKGSMEIEKKNGWKSIETSASISTPFPAFQTGKGAFNYAISNDEASSKISVGWNGRNIELDIGMKNLYHKKKMIEGTVELKTPYPNYNKIQFKTSLLADPKKTAAEISAEWPNNKKAAIIFEVNTNYKNAQTMTNQGKFEVNLPIATWEKNSIEWKHDVTKKSLKTDIKVIFDRRISTLQLQANTKQSYKVSYTGSLKFKSPLSPVQNLLINFKHTHHSKHWKNMISSLTVKYDSKLLKGDSRISYTPGRDLSAAVSFSSPFKNFKQVSIHERLQKKGNKYTIHNEFKWAGNKKITLDGDLTLKGPHYFESEVRLITPFKQYERLMMGVSHEKKNTIWKSVGKVSYGEGKTYSVNSEIGWNKVKTIKLGIVTPHAQFKKLSLENSYQGNPLNFKTSTKVSCDPHFNDIDLQVSFNGQNLNNIEADLKLTTPFEKVKSVGAEFKHQKRGKKCETSLSTEYSKDKKATLTSELVFSGWADNSGKIAFEMSPKYNFQVEHDIKLKTNNFKGSLKAKTPFKDWKQNSIDISYSGQPHDFMSTVELKFRDENVLLTASNKGKLHGKRSVVLTRGGRKMFTVELESAFKNQFEFTGSFFVPQANGDVRMTYDPKNVHFNSHGKLVINGKEFTSDNTLKREGKQCEIHMKLTTPYKEYNLISLDFTYAGKLRNSETDLKLSYGINKRITAHIQNRIEGKEGHLEAKLTSPYTDDINLVMDGKGPWHDMAVKNELTYGQSKKIQLDLDFHITKKSTVGNLVFSSPFQNFEDIKLSLNHQGGVKEFETKVGVQYATGKEITGTVQFSLSGTKVDAFVGLKTPLKVVSDLGISLKHDGPLNNFKSVLEINCDPLSTIQLSAEYRYKANGIKLDLSCTTPLKKLENIRSLIEFTGTRNDFQASGLLQYRNNKLEGSSSMRISKYGLNGLVKLTTPVKYLESFTASLDYSTRPLTVKTDVQLEIFGKKLSAGGDFKLSQSNEVDVKAQLEVPWFDQMKLTKLSYEHSGNMREFNCDGTLEIFGEKLTTEIEFRNSKKDNFNGKFSLSSSIESISSVVLSFDHSGDLNDFESRATANYLGKIINVQGSNKITKSKNEKHLSSSITIQTPFKAIRDVKFERKGLYSDEKYKGELSGNFNDYKLDYDFEYLRKRERSFTFVMREPRPMSLRATGTVTKNNVDIDGTLNWLTSDPNSNLRVLLKHNLKRDGRSLIIKCIHPLRTVGLSTDYSLNDHAFQHTMAIQWGKESGQNMDYAVDFSNVKRRNQQVYDGQVKFNTAIRSGLVKGKHVIIAGRSYSTDIEIQWEPETDPSKALKLSSDVRLLKSSGSAIVTLEHPYLSQPIKLESELNLDYKSKFHTGKVILSGARDLLQMDGKIAVIENRKLAKYNIDAHIQHRRSKLDVQVMTSFMTSSDVKSASAEMKYLMANNERKTVSASGEINTVTKELKAQIITPMKEISVTGTDRSKSNKIMYLVKAALGNKKEIKMTVDVDKSSPSFDAKIFYSPENPRDFFHVYGKYPSSSKLQLEAYHVSDRSRHNDALFTVHLDSSRILHTKLSWNPSLSEHIQEHLEKREGLQEKWAQVKQTVQTEFDTKKAAFSEAWQPVEDAIILAMEPFKRDMKELSRAAQYMYRTNQFYIQDIDLYMKEKFHRLSEGIKEMKTKFKAWWQERTAKMEEMRKAWAEKLKNCAARVRASLENTRLQVAQFSQEMNAKLANGWKEFVAYMRNINGHVSAWVDEQSEKMKQFNEGIAAKMASYQNEVEGKLKDWVDSVRTHPHVQNAINQITSLPSSEYFLPIKSFHGATMAAMQQHSGKIAAAYNEYMTYAKAAAKEQAKAFLDHEYTKYMRSLATDAYDKSKWAYNFYEVEETLIRYYEDFVENGPGKMKEKLSKLLDDYFQFEKTKVIKYDLQNGEIEIQVYLPVPIHSLNGLPDLQLLRQRYLRLVSMLRNRIPRDYGYFWDKFYEYKPISMDPITWIPPFKAHATLYGSKHYKTFDNHHFTFAAECTYILARDFRNGDFTVLVQYGKGKGKQAKLEKSLIVMAGGLKIELSATHKLTVDGRRAELPYASKETSITRVRHTIIIHNDKGLTVECDLENDRCTTTISGWYFGKTAGLFGTYDYEPFTDMMASDGIRADDINTFTQSWAVGRCRASNVEKRVEVEETSPRLEGLSRLFRDNTSPYRICYKQVDPEPFFEVGVNTVEPKAKSNRLPKEDQFGMCHSARFYVEECKQAGVPLRIPRQCVKCENPTSAKDWLTEGETTTLKRMPKPLADLVFVVENGKCNKLLVKKIKGALLKLNKALSLNKLKNTRFALVSYGGDGTHSDGHSHTLNGALFSNIYKLIGSMSSISIHEVDGRADAMQALDFASTLPFRAGASKTIILIPCTECHEETFKYPEMRNKLLDLDIRLHLLLHENIELNTKSTKTSQLYGVDRFGVFTDKSHKDKELLGDRALRRFVDVPKDICAVLAMDVDGSVFSAKNMMALRYAQQKRFYDILGRLVAKKAKPSDCQQCECTYNGQTVCRRCIPLTPFHLVKSNIDNSTENKTEDKKFDMDFKEVNKKTKTNKKPTKPVKKSRTKKNAKRH